MLVHNPIQWDIPTVLNTNARSITNKIEDLCVTVEENNVDLSQSSSKPWFSNCSLSRYNQSVDSSCLCKKWCKYQCY